MLVHIAVVVAAAGLAVAADAAAQKPNLLFMMADQLRWDALGVVNPGAKTPSLDSLAADGVRFTSAFTSTPTCTPARAALLTGQKPWNHGMLGYGAVAEKYPFEMPRALSSLGYSTTALGKDHFGWDKPLDEGYPHGYQYTQLYDGITEEPDNYRQWFEHVMPGKEPESGWPTLSMNSWKGAPYAYDEYYHPTAWVGRLAVNFIQNYSDPRPWFLKVSFHRPHSPYDPPQRVLDSISASDLPPIIVSKDGWDNRFTGLADAPPGCGPQNLDAWCGDMPDANATLARRAYYGSVAFVDEWVGKIVAALKERNMYDNTLIVWTADHGDGQGDHYHWRKGYPYELSAHIPMLLRWPNNTQGAQIKRGSTLPHLTELRDVFPTMLDGAGGLDIIPSNYSMDGDSLMCLVLDPSGAKCRKGAWRQHLDLEHSTCYNETNHWNALTDGEFKYIFKAWNASEQLFDLKTDPGETVDLAPDPRYAATLSKWRQTLVNQFEEEGRGPHWVFDGKLVKRVAGQTYSPNYPGNNPSSNQTCYGKLLKSGDTIELKPNAGADPTLCQDFTYVSKSSALTLISRPDLCLTKTADGTPDVTTCKADDPSQEFTVPDVKDKTVQIKHSSSGECIVLLNKIEDKPGRIPDVGFGPCPKANSPTFIDSEWVFGASGRLCHLSDGCLTIKQS